MSDEGDSSAVQDSSQDQGGGQEPAQEWVEPDPGEFGIELGKSPCIDECWRIYYRCLQTVPDRQSCKDQLGRCLQDCGPVDAGT
jgi:hypothetical protein